MLFVGGASVIYMFGLGVEKIKVTRVESVDFWATTEKSHRGKRFLVMGYDNVTS